MARSGETVSRARHVRRVQLGGFSVTEGVHKNGAELPWHHHESPTICFVLQGSFTEAWRGGSIMCTSSTLKVTPAGERHCDHFGRGDVRGLLIETQENFVTAIRPYSAILDERVSFTGGLVPAIAWRFYNEMLRTDAAAPLAMEGLLLELLAAASRLQDQNGTSGRPQWLEQARERIHADLAARPSLTGLAESVGVHPVTLARAFRRAFGCTVGEYVRSLRIERATRQLAETDLPLAVIALAEGFSDQSHFSNLFRQHNGLSPFQFRRAVRSA